MKLADLPGCIAKTRSPSRNPVSIPLEDNIFGVVKKFCEKGQLDKAVWTVEELMDQEGVQISSNLLYCVLQGCIDAKDLVAGRALHHLIARSGYETDTFWGSHLIRLFTLCGSLHEANQVFSKLPAPNVFTWSAIISAHAKLGQGEQAIKLYDQVQQSNVKRDGHVFVAVLKACANIAALGHGKLIHSHVLESGLDADIYVGNTLVNMYAKCGSVEDARRVFDRLPHRDVVTWDAMITGYTHHGDGKEALKLFHEMQKVGTRPNKVTYLSILKACSGIAALAEGKLIHAKILESGFEVDPSLGNTLVDMYSKCGSLKDAHGVFDRLPQRDVVTWGALVAGYVQHGHGQEVFEFCQQMEQEHITPDLVMFVCLLKACSNIAALEQGKLFHVHITEIGFDLNLFIGNSLIDMYTKCGNLEDALTVFEQLPQQDVVTWNVLIEGFVQHGFGEAALQLFQQMQQEGIELDHLTIMSILKACSNTASLGQGKLFHACLIGSGLELDVCVSNTLIDMYSKCEDLKNAHRVFQILPKRDVVTWSAMIGGCVQQGHSLEAFQLYQNMQDAGIEPNGVTIMCLLKACSDIKALEWGRFIHAYVIESALEVDVSVNNTLVDMYSSCASFEDACRVFDRLLKRDVVTWGTMIVGFIQCGHMLDAFQLFENMRQDGIKPDLIIYICLLNASSSIVALDRGKQIHAHLISNGFDLDAPVGNTVIDMYAKCGSLDDAQRVFNALPKRDVITWNILIAGYSQHGKDEDTLQILHQMQQDGLEPDGATYVNALKVCSTTSALHQGKFIHVNSVENGLEVDFLVGSTLIDMYARCGSLEDACTVFNKLPKCDVVTWSAMISGCAQHGNYKLALQYFQNMQLGGLEPTDAVFVCLLSACSHIGLVNQVHYQLNSMIDDHGIAPKLDHYNCVVDLLGRAGHFTEAEDLLQTLPFGLNIVGWRCLLSHCKAHENMELGRRCFEHIIDIDPTEASGYILMSHIYAQAGMQEEGENVELLRKCLSAQKKPAKARIEVHNKVHDFIIDSQRPPESTEACAKLTRLTIKMKKEGYLPNLNFVL